MRAVLSQHNRFTNTNSFYHMLQIQYKRFNSHAKSPNNGTQHFLIIYFILNLIMYKLDLWQRLEFQQKNILFHILKKSQKSTFILIYSIWLEFIPLCALCSFFILLYQFEWNIFIILFIKLIQILLFSFIHMGSSNLCCKKKWLIRGLWFVNDSSRHLWIGKLSNIIESD